MEEKDNLQELKIATLNSEQLQQKIDQESISWCEELIKDLEKLRTKNLRIMNNIIKKDKKDHRHT